MMKKNKVPQSRRVEILGLFQSHAEGLTTLPASALLAFLRKDQMELAANLDTAESLIDRYEIEEAGEWGETSSPRCTTKVKTWFCKM